MAGFESEIKVQDKTLLGSSGLTMQPTVQVAVSAVRYIIMEQAITELEPHSFNGFWGYATTRVAVLDKI